MELFNKYKNKDFVCITNYINSCINDANSALTGSELSAELLGTNQHTFEEIIIALLNQNEHGLDPKQPNANLFINTNNKLLPIRNNYVPIRPSIAEKAWLLYILNDEKAKLFLDDAVIERLSNELKSDLSLPDISKCIDIRSFRKAEMTSFSDEAKDMFRKIVCAIREQKSLVVTNTAFNGQVYENQLVYPYKLEYTPQFNSFSLSAYHVEIKRPIKMNLQNLSNVCIGEPISNYSEFIENFEAELAGIRESTPVTIEITDVKNGYDRCSYKFASFDRVCYENENGNLTMNIYYYRFQKDEIIRYLMFLGPAVRVIGPSSVRDEFMECVKRAYDRYVER